MKTFRHALLGAVALAGLASPARAGTAPIVSIAQGRLQGSVSFGVASFNGIPYAAPPVGTLRWRPPAPPATWTGVRPATAFGPQCAQPFSQFGHQGNSEDCLYLNVQAPAGATPASRLPVMVWLHGGAFVTGEGWDYDASALVTEGRVVVVTLNYRLGLLGFLAHPALAAEAGGQTGNYGLLDQQAALAWVRANIAAFGGNPGAITIFGESAGGQSVLDQLTSPTVGPLRAAIIESGAYAPRLPTLTEAEATATEIVADPKRGLNCTDQTAACLRALTPDQLVAAINPLTDLGVVSPVVGGNVLPIQPFQALSTGAFPHIPMLNGSNHDEWRLFTVLNDLLGSGPLPDSAYASTIAGAYGPLAPQVLAAYPQASLGGANLAYSATITDAGFACGAHLVDALAALHTTVYGYELNDRNAPDLFLPPDPAVPDVGDAHASELPYIFPLLQSSLFGKGVAQFSPAQQVLARNMRAAWTSFARYGRPLMPRAGIWAPYTQSGQNVQSLVSPAPRAANGFVADHHCDIWQARLLPTAGLPANTPY